MLGNTWERGGKAPSLAIEVVSRDSRKDYTRDPSGMLARYQDLGVKELVRYDPLWSPGSRSQKRRLLTHWVRSEAGELVEQERPQLNLVQLTTVSVLLLHVGPAKGWLRLAHHAADGLCLWPTRVERMETERQRAAAEAERAAAEAERATAEAARADQAEAQLVALRAELAALREGRSS